MAGHGSTPPPNLKILGLFILQLLVRTSPKGYHWQCVCSHWTCSESLDLCIEGIFSQFNKWLHLDHLRIWRNLHQILVQPIF